MKKISIKFGTDGWRGVIADEFTVEGVRIVSQGVSNYLKKKFGGSRKPSVVVGYDTRFLSERFAEESAEILKLNGIDVYISDKIITSPVLSYAVVDKKADLGVMITASHNPYYYNGYKIKGSFGGSATMDIIADVEKEVSGVLKNIESYKEYLYPEETDRPDIERVDFLPSYKQNILSKVDAGIIKNFDFKLLLEPMYGAAQGIYKKIIQQFNPENVAEIHSEINPSFGGINPEPIGDNLAEAKSAVLNENYRLAICLDGDGDRIAALGEDGNYISSHHLFAIVLWYLADRKKMRGKVVKSINLSSVLDKICSKYDLEIKTTPVGFKYIAEEILKGGVIMGGEESGGLWAGGDIPERDGMLMGLKLIEIICDTGMTLNQILKKIYDEFGYFVFKRNDYEIDMDQKENLKNLLKKDIPKILRDAGVGEVITLDGYKYIMENGDWVMIRLSGTEAVVRVYTEGSGDKEVRHLQELGKKVLESAY